MLERLIEELEAILKDTNKIKQTLDGICEKTWHLLSPPGKKGSRTFTIKTLTHRSESKPSTSVTANVSVSSSLENVFCSASDLIAYGKYIREIVNKESVTKSTKTNLDIVKSPYHKSDSNSLARNAGCKQQLHGLDGRSSASVKHEVLNKSLDTHKSHDSDASSACVEQNSKKSEAIGIQGDLKSSAKCESANKVPPNKYFHSCSTSLSDTAKSIKIPSDLLHLLKLYHKYEDNKLRRDHSADRFSDRFYNHVKSRLENDLKNNHKPEERFVKYLDVADSSYKSQENKIPLGRLQNSSLPYKSQEQLYVFEARYQRLMELDIQRRLINVINNPI